MQNKFLKTLALTGVMMGFVSCKDTGQNVPDKDVTPLTLVEKEIIPANGSSFGALYFDADGNKETYEYIAKIYDTMKVQKLADFKHQKIGTQKVANAWKYNVDELRKVTVRE